MTTDDFALPAQEFQAITALHWISRFGWLRARELGALMWPPRDAHPGSLIADDHRMNEQRKLASRLLSRLRESRYVLQRRLPGKAGDAYVLSGAGIHYLQRPESEEVPRRIGRFQGPYARRFPPGDDSVGRGRVS